MTKQYPSAAVASWRRRLWASLTATGLAVLISTATVLISAEPAAAHNVFRSSDPADSSTVDRVPTEVVLRFDQPAIALGTKLVVTGPSGEVQTGDARLIDNTVRQSLAAGAPGGEYTVVWRVTSIDGHPISGELVFSARDAAAGTAVSTTAVPREPPAAQPRPIGWIVTGVLVILAVAGGVVLALRRRQ